VSSEPGWAAIPPEWLGPGHGVLPGYLPDRLVLFRTPDVVMTVGRFDVYPTGIELTLELMLRAEDDDGWSHLPWEARRPLPASDHEIPDELLRLGVIYADGSTWSNLDAVPRSLDEAPPAPVVFGRGGGGGGGSWSMRHWLWPLPPPGPLTFVAEWPRFATGECHATIDAARLLAAGEQAETLW
jgi:hypothetical protein